MSKLVPRLLSIRCVAGACPSKALPRHALCGKHLAVEVAVLGTILLGGSALLVAAAVVWGRG